MNRIYRSRIIFRATQTLFICFIIIALHLLSNPVNAATWTFSTIDDSVADTGTDSSIAVDNHGYVHVSYYDITNGDLKYAYQTETGWQTETVDQAGDVGKYTSIAIDKHDTIYISYHDITNGDLKYARKSGGNWQIEIVESEGFAGEGTILAIDSTDTLHIAYRWATGSRLLYGTLKYATRRNDSWIIENIRQIMSINDMFLDNQNKAHITFRTGTSSTVALGYARQLESNWNTELIDSYSRLFEFVPSIPSTLSIDHQQRIHLVYREPYREDLHYQVRDAGAWLNQGIITGHGDVGWSISSAIDMLGNLHVINKNRDTDDLIYMRHN